MQARDEEIATAVEQAVEELSGAQYVENVESPLDGEGSVSEDGRTVLIDLEITGDDLEARDRLEPAEKAVAAVAADHPDLLVEQFGNVSANKELNETFSSDLAQAELISLPLTLLILVIAFGSLVAAGVPLLLAISCVMAAMALVALPSQLSPVDSNVQSVILLIGLAVGVDYSLFYIRREREERAAGRGPRAALEVAAATSGRAVLISGLTVIVAMAGMFLSGDKTFISFAEGTILVVALAMFASLTVLPALLAWLGDRINKGRIPFLARPLSPGLAVELARWKQEAEYRAPSDPVFPNTQGQPMDYGNLYRRIFKPAKEASGIEFPACKAFHRFRVTAGSLQHHQGKSARQVCDWIGHHDPAFTLRTYIGQVDEGLGDAAFLDELIPPAGGNNGATGGQQDNGERIETAIRPISRKPA